MLEIINFLFGRRPQKINANVEIYTWQVCPFCIRAKFLLCWKGVNFTEYKIDCDKVARDKMSKRANGNCSLPQIFINNKHIGGCDALYALNKTDKLDAMLGITL
ncbi:glutaredoxin 3 [Cyanobacterium sp. uoEpiScrs1]|uniref:glutaredoxin 3 n=1 Tax=Cyanobacterium sp. uoEpiScrs1 TaxID=2976343 RepID=UPI00226A6518|nr:glutaredoxin 3 [Cyanobacterium sp. uoEpiScrs1]